MFLCMIPEVVIPAPYQVRSKLHCESRKQKPAFAEVRLLAAQGFGRRAGFQIKSGMTTKVKELLMHYTEMVGVSTKKKNQQGRDG